MIPIKIGTRLTIALCVPIAILIALFGLLEERANRDRLDRELAREGSAVARTVQIAAQLALRDRQVADVRKLIDDITGYERVVGIRFIDANGRMEYQSANLVRYPRAPVDRLQRALQENRLVETRQSVGGQPVISFLAPLQSPSGLPLGAVEVFQLESFIEEDARASRQAIAVLTAAMILAVGVVLFFVTRINVTRPIEELGRSFRDVGSGDFRSRVPVRRKDELGRLAERYNEMCEKLDATRRSLLTEKEERRKAEESLREAEHLASIGRFSAGLAHEIGTPLSVIRGRAELLLRRGVRGEAGARSLRTIAAQIDRISRIVRGMLDFARGRELRLAPTRVADVIPRVTELMEHRFHQRGIRLDVEWPDVLPALWADADQLQEVFLNLALNAADAMPDGGVLRIEARPVERGRPGDPGDAGRFLAVVFEDTGQGIRPEHLDRVFDPFFTTKEVGEGTGLGLSVSYGIVKEHGGWIEVESEVDLGTRVTVNLPLAPEGVNLVEARVS